MSIFAELLDYCKNTNKTTTWLDFCKNLNIFSEKETD